MGFVVGVGTVKGEGVKVGVDVGEVGLGVGVGDGAGVAIGLGVGEGEGESIVLNNFYIWQGDYLSLCIPIMLITAIHWNPARNR